MLAALLILTATLSSPTEPGLVEARRAAADGLRSGLADIAEQGETGLPDLIAAAASAAESLGPGPLGAELRAASEDARSEQATRPASARTRLEGAIRFVLDDLEFEPVREAELPEGFPEPTPVGAIELKRYPVYRIARTDSGGNGAFWQLFMHIKKHDIPMTAPVEMTYDEAGGEVDMAFMYEHAAQGETGPDGSVEVVDIEPMLVVSVGCRGWSTDDAVESALASLEQWIESRSDLVVDGPARQFGYNGPSVRASRRYFEVQIPVRQLGGEQAAVEESTAGDDAG